MLVTRLAKFEKEAEMTPTERRYRQLYLTHYRVMRWMFLPFIAAIVFKLLQIDFGAG